MAIRALLFRSTALASAASPSLRTFSTVDSAEAAKFAKLASKWWDVEGKEFGGLHSMNTVRVPLVRDAAISCFRRGSKHAGGAPLSGLSILDIGCGGGILAEVRTLTR